MNDIKNKTMVYAADVRVLEDPALYAAAYAAASPARREKTDRYRKDDDRHLALGAELLLRYGLRESGTGFPDSFQIGEYGKPYLPDGEIRFNISHSGNWALCAVSSREVGCDIERIRPIKIKTARIFADEEYADILSREGEDQQAVFYRYWTLKECFIKVTGLGLKMPLREFHMVLGPKVGIVQSYDECDYRFTEFTAFPGYKCAVCTAGDAGEPELKVLDLKSLLETRELF